MTGTGDAAARARLAMVDRQLRSRGITDERVLDAMCRVPRERFVRAEGIEGAYADAALPIASGQTISQPYIVARMTELLRVTSGDRVLEVGTGSGYQAAILAALGCHVTTIERHGRLADEARSTLRHAGFGDLVEVRLGDGSLGDPDGAPWDGILVTAGGPVIPEPLREQLGIGRRLVMPVGPRDHQDLMVVTRRSANDWTDVSDGPVVFVPLVGMGGWDDRSGWTA
jgi:protein-L-isoaspartate(D-aspartate) O-methyltransferase